MDTCLPVVPAPACEPAPLLAPSLPDPVSFESNVPQLLANEGFTFAAEVLENASLYDYLLQGGNDAVAKVSRNMQVPPEAVQLWVQAYQRIHSGPKDAGIIIDDDSIMLSTQ